MVHLSNLANVPTPNREERNPKVRNPRAADQAHSHRPPAQDRGRASVTI